MAKMIAIDQGSKKCGFAYFEDDEVIQAGCISLRGKDRYVRYQALIHTLMDMVTDNNIREMAIEDIFLKRSRYSNPKVLKIMGETRGIITGVGLMYDLSVVDVNPSAVTSYLGINTRKDDKKLMTQLYVKQLLGYEVSEDAADAVIIGLVARQNAKLLKNSIK